MKRTTIVFTFIFLISHLLLHAQSREPADDLNLRLQGTASDSVSGGPPSVMIRRTADRDRVIEATQSIGTDPILDLLSFYNATYDRSLTRFLTVGGQLIIKLSPGLADIQSNVIGVSPQARLFLAGHGPKGLLLSPSFHFYTGDVTHDELNELTGDLDTVTSNFTITTAALDIGWRAPVGGLFYFEWSGGVEYVLAGGEDLKKNLALVLNSRSSRVQAHGFMRFGFNW